MAITKNAWLRYKILDKCLSNTGRKYTFDDLKNEIDEALSEFDSETAGISVRQLRKDLQFLQSELGYNAPIELIIEGRQRNYRYSERFSIHQNNLNETESKHLQQAILTLRQFEGRPDFEWMNELGPILENKYGEYEHKSVIGFDSNIDYVGSNLIPELFSAIVNNRVLEIKYVPFGQESSELIFHPYFLKQYNNRWFVFGLNEENNIPTWNFALDRIERIKETNTIYQKNVTDWDFHFSAIYGVSKPFNMEEEEVQLLFSKNQAPYIITKPLHESQKHYEQENGLLVKLKLIPNFELEQLILSFGENLEIISPLKLREKIAGRIKEMAMNYNT